MDWIKQLSAFRRAVMRALLWCGVASVACLYWNQAIYQWFLLPLLHRLPVDSALVATSLTSTVVVPLHLSVILGVFLSMPLMIYELWKFVVPALHPHEQRSAAAFLGMSISLFYLGVFVGYLWILPWMFDFFVMLLPKGVRLFPELHDHLMFSLKTLLNFGLCFQVPVIMGLLVRTRLLTLDQLRGGRRYFIVLAFVVAMLLTPPDVVSQILLAVPMCALYELGLWWGKRQVERRESRLYA